MMVSLPGPGPVSRIRLKGNQQHQARIAFVEFQEAKHAKEALDCSGALLGEGQNVACFAAVRPRYSCHVCY